MSEHFELPRNESYMIEVWVQYGIGIFIAFLRYIVRIRTVGFRGFQGDDYIAAFSVAMFTLDAVLARMAYEDGTNVDIPPHVVPLLTDDDIERLRRGSKAQLGAWYTYTALIWCMKFMMLFFYQRLAIATTQRKLVRYCFWMCGATYLAVFLTITFGCHPTPMNWQVRPLPSRACTFKPQNFYVGAILNVITDLIVLAIPIPMLWGLKIRPIQKIIIGMFICSGMFVIAAAVVRAVLTLGNTPSGININRWGARETIVGMLTVNLPILRPMFRKSFWRKTDTHTIHESSSYGRSSHSRSRPTKNPFGLGTFELRSHGDTKGDDRSSDVELVGMERIPSRSSRRSLEVEKNSGDDARIQNDIVVVEQTYQVSSSPLDVEMGNRERERENRDMGRACRTNISSVPRR